MRESWTYMASSFMHKSLPFAVSVILLVLSYIPTSFELANNARPTVALMCVYFWLVYRPDLFNLASVFLLGLIVDLMSMSPVGTNIFSFLIMYVLVTGLMRYLNGKVFVVLWCGFAVLLIPTMLGKWLVASIYYSYPLPLSMLVFSYLMSVAIYPIIGGINAIIFNNFLQEEW